MKILWVTNTLVGEMCDILNVPHPASGGWVEALLNDFIVKSKDQLVIFTTYKTNKIVRKVTGNITYVILPLGYISTYKSGRDKNKQLIHETLNKECIDVINIWGTEYQLGMDVVDCFSGIPAVVYIQGVMSSIERYYLADMSKYEIRTAYSLRDFLKNSSLPKQKKEYARKAGYEKKLINKSKNIIIENDWCEGQYKAICPNLKAYRCPLSIKDVFSKYDWSENNLNSHIILMGNASYPLKGLHKVLFAMAILKREYKDIKLKVCGYNPYPKSISDLIRQSGYSLYITRLIKRLEIADNVEFLPVQTSEKLAERMSHSSVFVLASSIENHSSSLKEAMMVGMPCVSSYVGGIPEYLKDEENGLLYRFEDYEMLAFKIKKYFDNPMLAKKCADNAKDTVRRLHESDNVYIKMKEIYNDICNQKNGL